MLWIGKVGLMWRSLDRVWFSLALVSVGKAWSGKWEVARWGLVRPDAWLGRLRGCPPCRPRADDSPLMPLRRPNQAPGQRTGWDCEREDTPRWQVIRWAARNIRCNCHTCHASKRRELTRTSARVVNVANPSALHKAQVALDQSLRSAPPQTHHPCKIRSAVHLA
jgi:hypothetical protein